MGITFRLKEAIVNHYHLKPFLVLYISNKGDFTVWFPKEQKSLELSNLHVFSKRTGKPFSKTLIRASTNKQHEKRLFMELPWKHCQNTFCACSFHGNSMNNLLSYCGLIDVKIRTSDKDLPVQNVQPIFSDLKA